MTDQDLQNLANAFNVWFAHNGSGSQREACETFCEMLGFEEYTYDVYFLTE